MFKDIFGREKELKEGEKYTYRKLPDEDYKLNKILNKAWEEKDYKTEFIAVKKINKLFPKSNLWTFDELFRFYYNGIGTRKNELKAFRYLMVAVLKKHLPAYQLYGNYLRDKKQYAKAAKILRKGLNQAHGGCAFALYKMMDAELAPKDKDLDYPLERLLALFVAKVRGIPEAIEIYDSLNEHGRFFSWPLYSPSLLRGRMTQTLCAYSWWHVL